MDRTMTAIYALGDEMHGPGIQLKMESSIRKTARQKRRARLNVNKVEPEPSND
jgi:hypothetical protein